ncbi:hypothetical protein ASD38_15965 [Caulobacter sp. Root487D2Y]|uniref:hypothetical protein n=1 Tax=Caulobacter sp. Root487D2Y TaxID=1736547 RepID=UPI0006FDB3C7|nr:hypothetical protein [Caulobacter sp. Root487D2Y]KQY28193.1 hypothetical protein ASD38_15965 [Caulobacter sp. Root487D2Y]
MTRILSVLIASTALIGAAAPAWAGPCERLAGGRYVMYLEGGRPSQLGTGIVDFRGRAVDGPVFSTIGPTPLPSGAAPGVVYGTSYVQTATCTLLQGEVARVQYSSQSSVDWTVAADGKSATLIGAQNTVGMKGWAARVPAP